MKKNKISKNWLSKQKKDPFFVQSKIEGYRSRSAFKLIEMNNKFKFLNNNLLLLDLGSSPGGWSQVASKKITKGKILAIDVENMKPTDKRIRKAEELLYNYTFQNKDAEPDDILKSLETIGSSRVKATTKPPTGMTLNHKNKIRSIQREYARLTKTKTPQRAKNMLVKKYGLKLTTIEKYLKTFF